MTPLLTGVLLGAVAGLGATLIVLSAPPLRRVRLDDRLAPYLRDTAAPSRLLTAPPAVTPFPTLERLLKPVLLDAAGKAERVLGGSTGVRRRLARLGHGDTVEQFRTEQVIWGGFGLLAALGLFLVSVAAGRVLSPLSVLLLAGSLVVGGLWGRDWFLSQQVRRREAVMLAEFPTVAELLALAVAAGEGPLAALDRVCRIGGGELGRELAAVLADTRAGTPFPTALRGLSSRTGLDPLARFVDGVVVAMERGTPLADVLRAQAVDVREAGRRQLLESAGKREIGMMAPVIFLVLPVTVVFALYPALIHITAIAR